MLSLPEPRQLDWDHEQDGQDSQDGAADKCQPKSRLVASHNLILIWLLQLCDSLNRGANLRNDVGLALALHEGGEVMHQRILDDETAARHAENEAQAAPEDERAGDDGLLLLRGAGERSNEAGGELEALADGRWDENEEVGHRGEVAAKQAQWQSANDVEDCADDEGPLQAAGVIYCEASGYAHKGGDDKGQHEAEARAGGREEEDGLEVEGSRESRGC